MKRATAIRRRSAQRGAVALEFALGAVIFFSFIFFMFELSRAFYLWNTLVEVTRSTARAAAQGSPTVASQLALRQQAMRSNNGGLPLGGELSADNLLIDHLNGRLEVVDAPACAADNLATCAAGPEAATCVRFVRVRLCASSNTACPRVAYQPLIVTGLVPFGTLQFPTFATITPVGTLGLRAGAATGCP